MPKGPPGVEKSEKIMGRSCWNSYTPKCCRVTNSNAESASEIPVSGYVRAREKAETVICLHDECKKGVIIWF